MGRFAPQAISWVVSRTNLSSFVGSQAHSSKSKNLSQALRQLTLKNSVFSQVFLIFRSVFEQLLTTFPQLSNSFLRWWSYYCLPPTKLKVYFQFSDGYSNIRNRLFWYSVFRDEGNENLSKRKQKQGGMEK